MAIGQSLFFQTMKYGIFSSLCPAIAQPHQQQTAYVMPVIIQSVRAFFFILFFFSEAAHNDAYENHIIYTQYHFQHHQYKNW